MCKALSGELPVPVTGLVGFETGLWDLIVLVPGHHLSFYFNNNEASKCKNS